MDGPRIEYPDLVGVDGEEAKAIIEKEHPELHVEIVGPGPRPMTRDFRIDRVRIITDEDNKVATVPRNG